MTYDTMVKIKQDNVLLPRLYACVYDTAWRILEGEIDPNGLIDRDYVNALAQGPEAAPHLLRPFITGLARSTTVGTAYAADPASVTDAQILTVVRAVLQRVAPPSTPAGA